MLRGVPKRKAKWAILAAVIGIPLLMLLSGRFAEPSGYELRRAAFAGNTKKIQRILNRNPACINEVSTRGETTTGRVGRSAMTEWVYQLRQVVRFATQGGQFDAWENAHYSALDMAVRGGHPDAIKMLLAAGANPHFINRQNFTALHQAIQKRQPELLQPFLDAKVSLETMDANGTTPLGWAALAGHAAMVVQLLNAGADPNGGRMPPLHWAAENGQVTIARALLLRGAGLNHKDFWERTPLSIAQLRSRVQMIEFLRSQGAAEDSKDAPPDSATRAGP